MPKRMTFQEIGDVVTRQAADEFIDVLENEFIEFKSEPYRLDEDQQKAELAKDLTTFANTTGGFIVLGVKTGKVPDYNADIAEELRPIPRQLLRQEQYLGIARDWIYPAINDLRIHFMPIASDLDKGLFLLEVPTAVTSDKPFLIVKTSDTPARKDRRILFGYAERFESRSVPAVVQRLQHLLRLGLTFDDYRTFQQGIEVRLERLESAVLRQVQIGEVASEEQRGKRLKEQLHKAAIAASMNDRSRLWLAAQPEQQITFPTFFSSRNDPFVEAFENPPELRDSGFDFALHRPSEIVNGSVRKIAVAGYKLIQLSSEGELIVMVPGDEDFLAWAASGRPGYPIRINSFVLAEVIYTFTLYVKRIYAFADPVPKSLKLFIGFSDMEREGKRPTLSSLEARPIMFRTELTDREASGPGAALYVLVPFYESAERVAFILRAELYHWFGFDDDHVPYVEEIDGKRVVTRKSLGLQD